MTMRILIQLILCAYLMLPMQARAVEIIVKDPLDYSLKQYGLILGVSLLGGIAAFYTKVRKGEVDATSITAFIGEMATSALAGLLTFWFCEYLNLQPVLTAAVVGMAGHMGARGIAWAEGALRRRADRLIGGDSGR
ncbi:hypothetical protein C1M51_02735 [Methylibium sp. Pch-M]|uniref:phage holin family protein n=1 Tax=Methylibium sp. Pch-M TaxID=2082386 RepID=UPI00101224A6|nr:phage holin family protein [Methylibium sp. Pch-M]QAZ38421.1 hypothetical protein C1M51_02735 [Methylibium sp. Pch-M]